MHGIRYECDTHVCCCSLPLEATSSFSTSFSGLGIVTIYLDATCPQCALYIEGCKAIHRNNLSFPYTLQNKDLAHGIDLATMWKAS